MQRLLCVVVIAALTSIGCDRPAAVPIPPAATQPLSLRVIPKPNEGTRTVLDFQGVGQAHEAGGDPTVKLDCAKCGNPLVTGGNIAKAESTTGTPVVLHCNKCDAYNEIVR